jgi:hypothetical protein
VARPENFDGSIYGHLAVTVADKDVDAGNIVAQQGVVIRGRISTADKLPPDFNLSQIQLSLQSREGSYFGRKIMLAADGTFAVTNVARTGFLIRAANLPAEFYLESARYGSRDVLDSGLTIDGESPGPLEIVLAGPGGLVEGTVRSAANQPLSLASALLIPVLERRGVSSNFFQSSSDPAGAFRFRGVRPGEYKLLLWEKALPENFQDPEFLKDIESRGVRVMVDRAVPVNVGEQRAQPAAP